MQEGLTGELASLEQEGLLRSLKVREQTGAVLREPTGRNSFS